jgi:putative ABC transport system ATP-binding protein
MTAMLELDQVTRVYGSGRAQVRALDGVSLRVARGELVAVMGPSGSGKSTLLNLAGGLDRPTAGRVVVDGSDLGALDRRGLAALRRRRVGYVFQDLNLLPGLTAAENVALPLELDGAGTRTARAEAVAALDQVGLRERAGAFPDQLSGGERQQVAIARAVAGRRALLLADEPTGALDSLAGETVLALIRASCDDGIAGVLVTHEARYAAVADRVVFLSDGRVVDQAAAGAGR